VFEGTFDINKSLPKKSAEFLLCDNFKGWTLEYVRRLNPRDFESLLYQTMLKIKMEKAERYKLAAK
jgi:hypothetical protein